LGHAQPEFHGFEDTLMPVTDQAFSALLDDLQERGLFEKHG
jgi:hypothetical protein